MMETTDEMAKRPTTEIAETDMAILSLPPVADMEKIAEELFKRQTFFKKMIFERLVEGRDYGFPPGCEQKYDADGNIMQWDKRSQHYRPISKSQWQAKPSLYVSGALELRDLFKQLGFPVRFSYARKFNGQLAQSRCELINEMTGQIAGEGVGAYTVGTKGADENTAMQMADNRAVKAAIRRTMPCCASLFTQDTEDLQKPPKAEDRNNETTDFAHSIDGWIREVASPVSPMFAHNATPNEVVEIRHQLAAWRKSSKAVEKATDNLALTVEWLKKNCEIVAVEGEDGAFCGITVQKAAK